VHAGGGAASARRPFGPVVGAAHSRVEGVARAVGERTRRDGTDARRRDAGGWGRAGDDASGDGRTE